MTDEIDDPAPESIELRRFDLHGLWRVLLWGASAAMAVAIVAGTAFSDVGSERLKQTIAAILEPVRGPSQSDVATQQVAALEKQTRELTQTVQDLTADRDRVKGRLAKLEQNLDDITGAIKRQAASTAARPQDSVSNPPKPDPDAVAQTPPPVVSAPATVAAVPSPVAATPTQEAPTTTASTAETTGPVPERVPLPPTRLASVAPVAAEPPEAAVPVTRAMGVDLGTAATIDALRTHWAGLKANIGPDLVGLKPYYATRTKVSGAVDYRLVLGPFPNGAAALRLCAKLSTNHVSCRAGTFTVQQLAEP